MKVYLNAFGLNVDIILNLKREVTDRLPKDLKKIFTAWKSCQVMIEMLYKKCIAPVGQRL